MRFLSFSLLTPLLKCVEFCESGDAPKRQFECELGLAAERSSVLRQRGVSLASFPTPVAAAEQWAAASLPLAPEMG